MFSSLTQPNYRLISPCGIFRMSGNYLFPLDGARGGWQGGGEREKKRGRVSHPENNSKGGVSNLCPLHHFGLPYSGESNSVRQAFVANNPVLGVV